MLKMGFNRLCVDMVMRSVSSMDFSILINKFPGKSFKLTRGFRQGDPLSPCLFLSCIFHRAADSGFLKGIQISAPSPHLSHLLFADDTLIFLRASKVKCENTAHLLKAYCHAQGQEVNLQKSVVYLSANTPDEIRDYLYAMLDMPPTSASWRFEERRKQWLCPMLRKECWPQSKGGSTNSSPSRAMRF